MVNLIWHKEGQKDEVVWWRLRGGWRVQAWGSSAGFCVTPSHPGWNTLALGVSCALWTIDDNWAAFICPMRRVTLFPGNFTSPPAAAYVCAQQAKLSCCWVRWWHPESRAVDPLSVGITSLLSSAKLCQQSDVHYGCMVLGPRSKITLISGHYEILAASFWIPGSSEAFFCLLCVWAGSRNTFVTRMESNNVFLTWCHILVSSQRTGKGMARTWVIIAFHRKGWVQISSILS